MGALAGRNDGRVARSSLVMSLATFMKNSLIFRTLGQFVIV